MHINFDINSQTWYEVWNFMVLELTLYWIEVSIRVNGDLATS